MGYNDEILWAAPDEAGVAMTTGEGLTARGQFLLAKLLQETGPQSELHEQLSMPQSVDHRADIYATGMVFYEMLSREVPGTRATAPIVGLGVTTF